jgi:hypothetical protein
VFENRMLKLKVFENRMLKRIFGRKREEVTDSTALWETS